MCATTGGLEQHQQRTQQAGIADVLGGLQQASLGQAWNDVELGPQAFVRYTLECLPVRGVTVPTAVEVDHHGQTLPRLHMQS
ncbi:hypothetical protein D3C76_873480 [compost metagenome]